MQLQAAEFGQFLHEKGQISVPCWLLQKHQALDIPPEELGYLLLALYQQQRSREEDGAAFGEEAYPAKRNPGDNPWMGWALEKGWATWKGEGDKRKAVFDPLWHKLYQLWADEQATASREANNSGLAAEGFDYSAIMKELDRLRGSLTVTVREKQLIQEFNIKYGWSTEFILNFFRLCFQRDLIQMKNYKPLAAQIHRSGIYTLEGLTAFMSEVDWIGKQAAEIKRDYLGLYGMVTLMERDYYVKWHITWRFGHALIVRAARESAGAANATFKYIDSIIERWHELGVDSLEASEEAIQNWHEEKKKQAKNRNSNSNRASGRNSQRTADKNRTESPWEGFALTDREE
ncbi:MAG: DnaD domain protein [Clostridiales bacterium]|nr:DnaD domain protein [Clostridiales bacterium]